MKEVRHANIAILAYHKIGDPPQEGWSTWNYVPAETFGKHLNYLRHNHWEVLDIDTFLKGMDALATLPDKVALITFDDGYQSNLLIALSMLPSLIALPGYPLDQIQI